MFRPYVTDNLLEEFMNTIDNDQETIPTSLHGDFATMTERYLREPLTTAIKRRAELGETDIKDFEKRFALLLNTLWKISYQHASILSDTDELGSRSGYIVNTTSTKTFQIRPVYDINVPWMIVYFCAVMVMFLAAVFSLVVHSRCRAPTILGFVSSLIRDSVYFADNNIQGNSSEDGTRKTRRLAELKIMVADIKGEDSVGKIALVPISEGYNVKRRRRYE